MYWHLLSRIIWMWMSHDWINWNSCMDFRTYKNGCNFQWMFRKELWKCSQQFPSESMIWLMGITGMRILGSFVQTVKYFKITVSILSCHRQTCLQTHFHPCFLLLLSLFPGDFEQVHTGMHDLGFRPTNSPLWCKRDNQPPLSATTQPANKGIRYFQMFYFSP